jgi:hypothetical protein
MASLSASGGNAAPMDPSVGGMGNTGVMKPPGAAGDPSPADAASDMAFGRAKDRAGLLAASRMKGARSAMGGQSVGQSARAVNDVLSDASSGLSDVATAQAVTQANRAAQVVDRNYAGALQKRGQNMSVAPSILALTRSSGRAY